MPNLTASLQKVQASLQQTAKVLASIGIAGRGFVPLNADTRKKIAMMIAPTVRAELAAAYKASGLKQKSGDLFRAAVNESQIIVTTHNIVVLMPAGKGKEFYAKAGALQFGGAHSKDAKRLKRFSKGKQQIAQGKRGKLLNSGKVIVGLLKGGGAKTGAFGYFTLDGGAVSRITARYEQLVKVVTGVSS